MTAIYDVVWYRAYKTTDLDNAISEGSDRRRVSIKAVKQCVKGDALVGDADTSDGRVVGWLPGYHETLTIMGI